MDPVYGPESVENHIDMKIQPTITGKYIEIVNTSQKSHKFAIC